MHVTPPPRTDLAVERFGAFGEAWLAGMWQADPLADAVANDPAGAVGGN